MSGRATESNEALAVSSSRPSLELTAALVVELSLAFWTPGLQGSASAIASCTC